MWPFQWRLAPWVHHATERDQAELDPGGSVARVVGCAERESDLLGGPQQLVDQLGLVVREREAPKRRAGKLEKQLRQVTLVYHVLKAHVDAREECGFHGAGVDVYLGKQLSRQRAELLTGMINDTHASMVAPGE